MAALASPVPLGLQVLLTRHSVPRPKAPGPTDEEIDLMFRAVRRVPDFQHLQPYRFLLARDEGLVRLGAAMERAAVRSGQPVGNVERARQLPMRAPLVAIGVFRPRASSVVSRLDQLSCAICALFSLQLAAHALGYSGIWRSGWLARNPAFHQELELRPDETIVGFLYLGTTPTADLSTGAAQHLDVHDDVAFQWL